MTIEFIDNPANKEKVKALSLLSDMHKDAYGFRPRYYNYEAMSIADIQEEIEKCSEEITKNMTEEKIQMEEDVKAFKALIDETIGYGAGDIITALRWLFDGSGVSIDEQEAAETFAWKNGIMFSDYGRIVVKELNKILYN